MLLSGGRAGWGRFLAGLTAVTLVMLGITASAGARGFCENEVIRDYAKPLERLPQVLALPFEGRLDFAPGRVSLGSLGRGPLQLGSGERGFSLSYSPYEAEATKPTRRLDWHVTSRLVEVDRRGRRIGEPELIEKHVERLWPTRRGLDFTFQVPGKPALYRLELVFENRGGKRLARFGENFRVLRATLDVGLALSATTLRPGETVRARLLNRGAAVLFFGLGRSIEYFDGTNWIGPPPGLRQGPIPAIGLFLPPGGSGSCWQATIPPDAPAGLYRFGVEFDFYKSYRRDEGGSQTVSSEFTVLPE
jgi:hypothetical protein